MPSPFRFYRHRFAVYCGQLWHGTDNPKMTQAKVLARHLLQGHTFLCIFAAIIVLFTGPVQAQDEETFDPISVSAELDQLASELADEGVEPPFLAAARAQVIAIDAAADVCLLDATEEFGRLEARF